MKYICLCIWEGPMPIGELHRTVLEQLQKIRMPPDTPIVVTSTAPHDQIPKHDPTTPVQMIFYAEVPDTWEPSGATTGAKR
jgi:hypothetical protein